MSTIEEMTLAQVGERLEAVGGKVAKAFEEMGAERDTRKITVLEGDSGSKVAQIIAMNEEMTELGKRRDQLVVLEGAKDRAGREVAWSNQSKGASPIAGAGNGTSENAEGLEVRDPNDGKSLGRLFTESKAFTEYSATAKRSPEVELTLTEPQTKALLDTTGFVTRLDRGPMILPAALRRPVVADLIPQGTTNQRGIVYMEETTATNAAAAVAEGAAKPESTLIFTEQSSMVRKLATVLPVTDELMDDEPAMRSYVEQRLRLFLQLAEEAALINGNGTAPNLRGMMNVAGIQTQAKGADPTPDAIYKAMTKIRITAFLEPSGAIFHPNDWQEIRLLRTADGLYIWGAPMDAGPERIWGMPIVQTVAATEGTALVAAFDTATQIFRRTEVAFAVSDQHSDFFASNKLMLRVEERLAFVVYRPAGICSVTGI